MIKSLRIIAASIVFFHLGWTLSARPRQEAQEKPKDQERQQAKPAEKQQDTPKPARRDRHEARQQKDQQQQQRKQQDDSAKQQQQARRQQDQQRKQQDLSTKEQQQQAHREQVHERLKHQSQQGNSGRERTSSQVSQQQVAWRGDRANSWQSEHRTWQQRGGYSGYRVPEDRFRGFYGQGHGFRIYTLPVVFVGGHRRFQYGGYWFGLIDPWPEYWDNDWYDNDDVYVDYYNDGYYLYNRRYPDDRIAIAFYLN
jgi:hypothetical protein